MKNENDKSTPFLYSGQQNVGGIYKLNDYTGVYNQQAKGKNSTAGFTNNQRNPNFQFFTTLGGKKKTTE